MAGCPECAADNRDGARFCSSCGARLANGAERAGAVRKAVTVLFSDISGFTPLTAGVDAERLGQVMNRYFGAMQAVIERHGGQVEKFIGDAVMAVFGVPRLREDDALRAVRAAVDMRDTLDGLNEELEREWGIALEVHTGVNTGEVATADGPGGSSLILGDAVNVAARLQQAAGPREILLGPTTHRLVEGAVDSELLEPLTLKGKAEPVDVFRLVGLRAAHAVPVRRMDTPLIGRTDEYGTLAATFERAQAQRACHIVLVTGLAGVGKSRLVTEFVRRVRPEAAVAQGHCPSYGEGITFWPLGEVIRETAGIAPDDAVPQAREKLAAVVAGEPDADVVLENVGHVLGLTGATVGPEVLFWAVRRLLETAARRRPLVVVFEDIHWAQPTFLELIAHIGAWTRDAPLLVCCTARSEFLEGNPDWGAEGGNVTRIDLSPLSEGESASLIGNLLASERAPGRAWARVIEAAQGNPLYLQEMVSKLIDDGRIRRSGGGWVPSVPLQDLNLPLTLQSLLASRVDALDAAERRVLEVAAVVGTAFDRTPLLELGAAPGDEQLLERVGRLADKGFFRGDATDGDRLSFQHALLREATYNSMSKEARARLHERFADWLERTPQAGRAGETEEVLGYHLERAHHFRAELHPEDDHGRRLAERAGAYLAPAGRKAFSRGDVVAATNLLSRAVALLAPDDSLRLGILPTLSEALMMTGDLEQAGARLDEAFQGATERGDRAVLAHVVLVQTTQRLFTQPEGWVPAARSEVEAAIPIFEELDDRLGLARSWRLLSLIELSACRYAATEAAMARSAEFARLAGDRREELESLSWLPLPLFAGPTPAGEGIQRCQGILDRAEGDRKVEGSVLLIRAALEAMTGDVDRARTSLAAAKEAFEDLGLQFWIAGPVAQFAGWVELAAGDPVAAERELRPGFEALRQMGESSWLSTVAAFLARSMFDQGRYDEADEFARITLEAADSQDVYSQVLGRAVKARTHGVRGAAGEARRLAEEAVQLAATTDCPQLQADALMDLAEINRSHGRADEATRDAKEALRLHERKGNMLAAGAARDRLALISRGSVTMAYGDGNPRRANE